MPDSPAPPSPGKTTARSAKWRSFTFKLLFFVLLLAGIRAWQQRDMISGQAPALHGMTLGGQEYTLPSHPAHPLLLHFWASWCNICRAEQNSITALAHDVPDVMTIAMQSGPDDEVLQHMQTQGISFPVINDESASIARSWGVHAVPASFIISPDGQIRFIEVGYTTGLGLRLRLWLAGFFR